MGQGTTVDPNMKSHAKTYGGFLEMMKWGVIVIFAALILMAVFLA